MSHPTTEELFEFIDNRRGKEETDKIAAHLAVCPACRQRVEMERSIKHIVRHEPLFNAPAGLAALVMVNVAAPSRDSLALRVLGKLGSLVAMAVVLAVIGFAIVQVSSVNDQSDKTLSSITKITGPLSTMYTKGMQTFYHRYDYDHRNNRDYRRRAILESNLYYCAGNWSTGCSGSDVWRAVY